LPCRYHHLARPHVEENAPINEYYVNKSKRGTAEKNFKSSGLSKTQVCAAFCWTFRPVWQILETSL
jgi:hypothetical protein